jgi:hypothetical protein
VPAESTDPADALGLSGRLALWARSLPDPDGGPREWLTMSDAALDRVLVRLGFAAPDREDVIRVRSRVAGSPVRTRLVDAVAASLRPVIGTTGGDVRDPDHAEPLLPDLPTESGAFGRYFYVLVMLSLLPDTLAYHAARGVPPDVTWSTLSDLGVKVSLHRAEHGTGGLDKQLWLSYSFRGALYALGRLQIQLRLSSPFDAFGFPGGVGSPQIALHIPGTGPLTPASVDSSLALIDPFVSAHFPEYRTRLRTCTSWLLDPQLRQYLPPTSNIIRFQDRFAVVAEAGETSDDEVLMIAFGTSSPTDIPDGATALQVALLAHLREGGHWRTVPGWFED